MRYALEHLHFRNDFVEPRLVMDAFSFLYILDGALVTMLFGLGDAYFSVGTFAENLAYFVKVVYAPIFNLLERLDAIII